MALFPEVRYYILSNNAILLHCTTLPGRLPDSYRQVPLAKKVWNPRLNRSQAPRLLVSRSSLEVSAGIWAGDDLPVVSTK